MLVQTTTAGNLAARLAKVKAVPELPGLLAAGCMIHVHGWKRIGDHWHCKIVEVRAEDLEAVVVCPLPTRRSRRLQQGNLFAERT